MSRALQLFQAEASFIERLFRETLHPKRPSQHRPGYHMVIRIVINHATAIPRRGGKSKNPFQILLGLARSASRETRGADLLIGEAEVYRVANTMSDLLDPFRRDLRPAVFSVKGVNRYQRQQSFRLRLEIIQYISGFECLGQESFCLVRGTHRDEDRTCEVRLQLHSQRPVRGDMRFKTEQRAFATLAAFTHQRQVSPDRRIGGCEVDANRLVPGRGEGPVERRANVVDLSNMAR